MTFALLGRTALLATRRRATAAAAFQQAKRRMGGAAAAPEWTGIDKVVRGYFPQDDQREFFFCMGVFLVWGGMRCCYLSCSDMAMAVLGITGGGRDGLCGSSRCKT